MTPDNFVNQLNQLAVEENLTAYRGMFGSTVSEDTTAPHFRRAAQLFGTLSDDDRKIFFEVMRQVAIDTVSNVLGIVDGSCYFPGNPEFTLTADGKPLHGDLQDLFLAAIEEDQAKA